MIGVKLGRSFSFRRQGGSIEKAESLLIASVNNVLEDAVIYLITSKTNKPMEDLTKFLNAYAVKSKNDPGPQAKAPDPEAIILLPAEIMAQADPVFQHLSYQVVKQEIKPAEVCKMMAAEMERLLANPEELTALTNGLYSVAIPEGDLIAPEDGRAVY